VCPGELEPLPALEKSGKTGNTVSKNGKALDILGGFTTVSANDTCMHGKFHFVTKPKEAFLWTQANTL
jgi:hypothetical protein